MGSSVLTHTRYHPNISVSNRHHLYLPVRISYKYVPVHGSSGHLARNRKVGPAWTSSVCPVPTIIQHKRAWTRYFRANTSLPCLVVLYYEVCPKRYFILRLQNYLSLSCDRGLDYGNNKLTREQQQQQHERLYQITLAIIDVHGRYSPVHKGHSPWRHHTPSP